MHHHQPDGPRIIVAMDYDNAEDCLTMARRLSPGDCRLKVGKELFTTCGPDIVRQLADLGFDVFLDLKFHDIPNTTAKAVAAAARLGVWMVNVHASGGERMMLAARDALEIAKGRRPLLIGVTVLTSMDSQDLRAVGISRSPEEQVLHLGSLAKSAGLDGVVCSAQEAPRLSAELGAGFALVTPGIRPVDAAADDQRRTLTPAEALRAGSHYLVIGRPITRAPDPIARCREIIASLPA
ncbi:orotidine-5'-phosphate decarboxylase [Marinimicrobium alkaliphilum]|uniref:orotidine-5'-phosphate decarboxylase n=1 Tax=Marinimicrobium alkaliphilum TaxID=2202654 RepID=UPI000DB972CB|nr:orotidine-5'-phosphate decarboxylase [Marinimicrobium alkaliphilum]